MKKIPGCFDNTTLAEYLKEPLTKSLITRVPSIRSIDLDNFDPESEIVKLAEKTLFEIYYDFNYLAANVDNPGAVLFNFEMDDSKLPIMELMVDYYALESTPILERMMESLYNFCNEYDLDVVDSDYMENKLNKVLVRFKNVKKLKDTKAKLRELIVFKQYLSGLYFRDTDLTTKTMILDETEVLINNLQELESLGLLELNIIKQQKKNTNSTIKLASKRKTDIIKILSSMYDTKIFVDAEGNPTTNKQKLMEAFGEFLGEDFSKYSTSLSQAKTRDEKTFLKPFKEIEKEALRYFNAVGEE